MRTYVDVLAQGPIGTLMLLSAIARLPIAMTALALVLFVHHATGSFASAGLVVGGYALGVAVSSPLMGRVADRRGSSIFIPGSILQCLLLVAIVVLGGEVAAGVLVAVAALAGVAGPPTPSLLRARLPQLLERAPTLLSSAYALDSVIADFTFTAGPLLTALLAAVFDPSAALLAVAAASLVGPVMFLLWLPRSKPAENHHASRWGPLRSPAIVTLVLAMFPFGLSLGAFEVVVPAYCAAQHAPNLAGVLIAAWGIASVAGALLYGGRVWAQPVKARHFWMSVSYPLAYLPILGSSSITLMSVLVLPGGFMVGPIMASRNEMVSVAAPSGTQTEAFTWVTTALMGGVALGAAISGSVVDRAGWQAGVGTVVVSAALATATTVTRHRTLDVG
jgi:predicted MFS family arabinose efflux permease